MNCKVFYFLLVVVLFTPTLVNSQINKRKIPDQTKVNLDSNDEKLKKMSIRIEIENEVVAKDSILKISKDKAITIKVLASVSDQRTIGLSNKQNKFILFTPLLLGNNDTPFAYPDATQDKLKEKWNEQKRSENPNTLVRGGGPSNLISPGQQNLIGLLNIADWYGKLEPGVYRAVVLFGFGANEKEQKIQSNVITFEVF